MTQKSNVYTRQGDSGTTFLASGQRVSKTHVRLEAYGTLDELSSHIGLLCAFLTERKNQQQLLRIQHRLFAIGAVLATEHEGGEETQAPACISPKAIADLEHVIDELDEPLGGWHGFILPHGTQAAAQAHVCRTVCRRLERRMYAVEQQAPIPHLMMQYVNRLSDYFFVLAKHFNAQASIDETLWDKELLG